MKHVLFELSMPNNNAWDGKWTQADKLHCRVRSYPWGVNGKTECTALKNVLATPGCYYDFGDGWGAYVKVRECTATEKTKYQKATQGFCGYDWMIDELEKHGRILNRAERLADEAGGTQDANP